MAKSNRKDKRRGPGLWPTADAAVGPIELRTLPPSPKINGKRLRELTGDDRLPPNASIQLRAFRALAGSRLFHVGFCIGDGSRFSAIGLAVIERLTLEAPKSRLYAVPIKHPDIAWDIVRRHLREFAGKILLFAFSDSEVYDAGTAEIMYSQDIVLFDEFGVRIEPLTDAQRREVRRQKAAMLGSPEPTEFFPYSGAILTDSPWIFRFKTPSGKEMRLAVWNGRRNYAHELPEDILRWVGGNRIAIVQVDSPVGVDRRSSLALAHTLATEFDGIIHWARDSDTFHSILKSFIRLDLESVAAPEIPRDWNPEVVICAANPRAGDGGRNTDGTGPKGN